ncbi:hypothetical protein [Microvirga arabica]|uniref:hypothetical protein n=1 Tax=Microvirga arabica TaxID=1128671 RepID=UPI00193A0EC7|nr:hypothetical protein [Microvirga arabica]MBM1173389.1 hypothetical protein [Microvirga arabica]
MLSLPSCGSPHDSDAEFIAWFLQSEGDFIRLQEMALEETAVEQIASDFCRDPTGNTHTYPSIPQGFSLERWDVYRRLFKKLGLDAGISIHGPDSQWIANSVMMTASTAGILISGSEKGYLWSRTAPEPLVERLDHPLPPEGGKPWKYLGFMPFKPNWYLYYWST